MREWRPVAQAISKATGGQFVVDGHYPVPGGCINSTGVLTGGARRYLVKLNDAARLTMFEAEADGLRELLRVDAVTVPGPICTGIAGKRAFLVLEYLELRDLDNLAQTRLGEQLAHLHRITHPRYGWHRDNTIGVTPQINTSTDDWVEFWRAHRLGYQLDRALANGYARQLESDGNRLLESLPAFFAGYTPAASLLHGDLWSGNIAATCTSAPVIYDPAVYFGDRETDLAMTELFGGLGVNFYAAYRANWPLDPGYAVRKDLYNLYHLLNHLNLFGHGYLARAEMILQRLLIEVAR